MGREPLTPIGDARLPALRGWRRNQGDVEARPLPPIRWNQAVRAKS
jgi:hypothetical protein